MDNRDRTYEFYSTIKSLQSRQMIGSPHPITNVNSNQRTLALKQSAEFGHLAKEISGDLANTYVKLEKLTLLASNKSLFDDKSREIAELTAIIKSDMSGLNTKIMQLSKILKSQSTSIANKHRDKHSNSILYNLQTKLASASNDFKSILEKRSEVLKERQQRADALFETATQKARTLTAESGIQNGGSSSAAGEFLRFQKSVMASPPHSYHQPPSRTRPNALGNLSSSSTKSSQLSDHNVALDMPDNNNSNNYPKTHQIQTLAIREDQTTSVYDESRSAAIQSVESTIIELGGLFTQLATMVREQEEVIQRIDTHVESTVLSIEGAHTEILRYFRSLSSNRWLMIKIFAILIIFVLIFVLFFA